MGTMENRRGGAFNTVRGIGSELGSIVGIKGGSAWMREQFALNKGWTKQWGSAWAKEGLGGLGRHAQHFFGFGFKREFGAMDPYLKTMAGGARAVKRMGYAGSGISAIERTARRGYSTADRLASAAPGMFTRRRIAGGVAAGAALVGLNETVGIGNAAIMAGTGLGMAATARYLGSGRKVPWTGARAGKAGVALAGLGLITGVI